MRGFSKLLFTFWITAFLCCNTEASPKIQAQSSIISHEQFQSLPPLQKLKMTRHLFHLLSLYENIPQSQYCVTGAEFFKKRERPGKDCRPSNNDCIKGYVRCGSALQVHQCVLTEDTISSVDACTSFLTDVEFQKLSDYLSSSEGRIHFYFLRDRAIDVCKNRKSDASCKTLKFKTMSQGGKRPFSKFVILFNFLIHEIRAMAGCSFDEKTGVYQDHGKSVRLFFGVHHPPEEAKTFDSIIWDPKASAEKKREAGRNFIAASKMDQIRKLRDEAYQYFEKNGWKHGWIGSESSIEHTERIGGKLSSSISLMKFEFDKYIQAGFSKEVANDLVLLRHDAVSGALFKASQDPKSKFHKNPNDPPFVGVDNMRNKELDELNKNSDASRKALRAQMEVKDWNDPVLGTYESTTEKGRTAALSRLDELLAEAKKMNDANETNRLIKFREAWIKHFEDQKKVIDADKLEMEKRDRDIGTNLEKLLDKANRENKGRGVAFFGAAHKDGVLKRLKDLCNSSGSMNSAVPAGRK